MCSGMVWFQTVPRKTPEIMSAAPDSIKKSSTSQMLGITPASPIKAVAAAARRSPGRGGAPGRSSR